MNVDDISSRTGSDGDAGAAGPPADVVPLSGEPSTSGRNAPASKNGDSSKLNGVGKIMSSIKSGGNFFVDNLKGSKSKTETNNAVETGKSESVTNENAAESEEIVARNDGKRPNLLQKFTNRLENRESGNNSGDTNVAPPRSNGMNFKQYFNRKGNSENSSKADEPKNSIASPAISDDTNQSDGSIVPAVAQDSPDGTKTTKSRARFPNVNVLLQKYGAKQSVSSNGSALKDGKDDEDSEAAKTPSAFEKQSQQAWNWVQKTYRGRGTENKDTNETPVSAPADIPDVGDQETMCGGLGRYPSWLQRFATPRHFLLAFCLQNVLQGAAASLFIATATSIEKHFHFSSKELGSILMFSEIGPIFSSLALSHLGGRGNRPRWMAFGQMLSMMGLLLAFANYLMFPPPVISEHFDPEGSRKLCRYSDLITELVVPLQQLQQRSTASLRSLDPRNCFAHNQSAYFSWLLVHTLIGIGNSLVYTVGAPYLDDSISKKDSPLYFAISISVRILGPLLGFSITAGLLKVYVHPFSNPGLLPSDPRWVGAWWIGCLGLAGMFSVVAVWTSLFPRSMNKSAAIRRPCDSEAGSSCRLQEDSDTNTNDSDVLPGHGVKPNSAVSFETPKEDICRAPADQDGSNGVGEKRNGDIKRSNCIENSTRAKETLKEKFKDLWDTLKRLCKNPIIVYGITGDFFSLSGAMAIFMWLPKYLEHQFRVDKSTAALFTGISGTSSIIIGVLGGGLFIKRCRPSAKTLTLIIIVCKVAYILTLIGMMNIHCDFNDDLPGVLSVDGEKLDLYRGCSGGCECSQQEFIPVCVTDGPLKVTFFSPCHAGCYTDNKRPSFTGGLVALDDAGSVQGVQPQAVIDDGTVFYSNCSCGSRTAEVRSGYCRRTCGGFTLFNLIHAAVNSFVSIGTIGGVLISLRCVSVSDKASSLGLKSTVLSFAMLLNPVIFGSVTDTSCLVWEEACGQTGACWVYDARNLGYKIFTGAIFLFSIAVIFEIFVYFNVKDLKLFDDDRQPQSSRKLTMTFPGVLGSSLASRFSSKKSPETTQPSALRNTFKKFSKSNLLMDRIWHKNGQQSEKSTDDGDTNSTAVNEGGKRNLNPHQVTNPDSLQDVSLEHDTADVGQGYVNQAVDLDSETSPMKKKKTTDDANDIKKTIFYVDDKDNDEVIERVVN